MNEIIERVARAISTSFREEGAFWDGKWETEVEQAEFHKAALAAIEAMRKPPRFMWVAGAEYLPIDCPDPLDAHHVFQAMIDCALKE